jgi:hypothetical protein
MFRRSIVLLVRPGLEQRAIPGRSAATAHLDDHVPLADRRWLTAQPITFCPLCRSQNYGDDLLKQHSYRWWSGFRKRLIFERAILDQCFVDSRRMRMSRQKKKHVLGVVNTTDQVDGLIDDLHKTRVPDSDIEILRGEGDTEALDIGEGSEGIVAKIERAAETFSEEHELDEIYQRELEAGRLVIGVPVTDALDKSSAQRLLEKHGGRFINYYGSWAVEELKR